MQLDNYETHISAGSHWSLIIRRGIQMQITDIAGGSNIGMMFYNPTLFSEKYNAPDTLKCQHTFKLTKGHCLYSDMGRIFCSITEDSFGWHESICGNSHASHVAKQWGKRDYQSDHNAWKQNGNDSFLVELAKYGMDKKSMVANINWFSQVSADSDGNLALTQRSKAGDSLTLRFEMDTLIVLHSCPHPLNSDTNYPEGKIHFNISKAPPVLEDDYCLNFCPENQRGFTNNALYHLGV